MPTSSDAEQEVFVLESVLDFLAANQNFLGFMLLLFSAMVEYLFPPFPGDSVTLMGGILVSARGWSPVFVLSAVTIGSLVGSLVDYGVGCWLRSHPESWFGRKLRSRRIKGAIEDILSRFAKHGAAYLALNRFIPGIRAFFFVAAGLGGLKWISVAFWGVCSALLWNGLVLFSGGLLGGEVEAIQLLFERYTLAAWGLITIVFALWLGSLWRSRRRDARSREAEQ
ncbi:MAG: hypothetical protein AUK47_23965 [Deltaproteobacteria bacterium CG2_30_63_29]|nr:MAG: hypothetical protein AUK47_23965 [Deltaproteobacteria bacterium CG2_30_63_29]PIV99920.1 MAG: hypothetical protein COW42_09505 [Deltaproteobacteria bacterium CG17_big_fil_post_rev_8_21_14_2_50_63_7]PJB35903.1 MAG: hypothetical protein CO108_24550 [Deltaproteobacteria bacterium CG_4_9_14_3_um_filter_63_12]